MRQRLAYTASAATLLAISATAVMAAVALGHGSPARPDLRIGSGAAKVTTVVRRGRHLTRLTGSFIVRDAGHRGAPPSSAWVGFSAHGHLRRAEDFRLAGIAAGGHLRLTVLAALPPKLASEDWTIEACAVLGRRVTAAPAHDGCAKLGTYDLAPGHGTTTPTTPTTPTTTSPGTSVTPGTTTAQSSVPPASQAPAPPTTTTSTPAPLITPSLSGSTKPTAAVPSASYSPDTPFFEPDGLGAYDGVANEDDGSDFYDGGFFTSGYWLDIPPSYDKTNNTPETLLVWMHGCGGVAKDDDGELSFAADTDRPYIVMALNGPEGGELEGPACWDTSNQTDVDKVLRDVAQVETEFNIDKQRVILGGYSSGGDLAYQTMFTEAQYFAGVLAINTNPTRDNTFGAGGLGANGDDGVDAAIASAEWRFPIVQVSHSSDDTYHIDRCGYTGYAACDDGSSDAGVRPAINLLEKAGFSVNFTVLAGHHYDAPAPANCDANTPVTCTSGTYYDIVHSLLATIGNDGWSDPNATDG